LLLFLASVLAGCSGNQKASHTLQQDTSNNNKITDTPNTTNSQQEAGQQTKTTNQDTGLIKLIPATVSEVVGDTLHVQINGREEKVRLICQYARNRSPRFGN